MFQPQIQKVPTWLARTCSSLSQYSAEGDHVFQIHKCHTNYIFFLIMPEAISPQIEGLVMQSVGFARHVGAIGEFHARAPHCTRGQWRFT
jgi:hypothetical protein